MMTFWPLLFLAFLCRWFPEEDFADEKLVLMRAIIAELSEAAK
jgi:hypothetical protein